MLNETMKREIAKLFPELGSLIKKFSDMEDSDMVFYREIVVMSIIENTRKTDGELLGTLVRHIYKINQEIDEAMKQRQNIYG